MTALIRTCPKCGKPYKGRCPRCNRRASSRPVGRRQHAIIMERLVRIEPAAAAPRQPLVTTSTFVRRWLDRAGVAAGGGLTDAEYMWLVRRSSNLADRWQRRFGALVELQDAPA